MSAPSLPLPAPALPVSQAKPPEAPKPQQTTTLVAPVGTGAAELIVPHLWENRLDGVNPCSHETGLEIVVTVNKPQNGLSVCGTGALPDGIGVTGAITTTTQAQGPTTATAATAASASTGLNSNNLNANAAIQNSPVIQNLIKQQQRKVQLIMPQQSVGGGGNASAINTSAAQNLIQSLKHQQLVSSAALLSQSGTAVLTGAASLTNILRQQQQQRGSVGLTVTSGRTTTNASTAVGSVSSVGMAAVGNGRLPPQDGAVNKLGGSHIQLTGGTTGNQLSNIKVSLTAGAASTNPFGSGSVSASMVSNGPTIVDMDTGNNVGGSKFVSDSEIRLQEEKVRQLRQQVLAAAQAAAKGSAVV